MMETIIAPMHWDQVDVFTRYLFRQLRDPVEGRRLNVDQNFFVEKLLPAMAGRELAPAELDAYRAPFRDPASRIPVMKFPQQIPFDGDPPAVAARVAANYAQLRQSGMPLLLLYAEPGAIVQGKYLAMLRRDLPRMTAVDIGPGIHFIQEAQPTAIGNAIERWLGTL